MKLEKKHWIIIGVVVAIIAVWYFFLRKKKAESSWKPVYRDVNKDRAALKGISLANISTFGTPLESSFKSTRLPFRVKMDILPPSTSGKWISSIENGQAYCRWYDANGNNTVTYNRPCTPAQANM